MLLRREVSAAQQETAARLFESYAESRDHKPEVSAHPHERALAAAIADVLLRSDSGRASAGQACAKPAGGSDGSMS
jgi:hypothetical protein